MVPQYKRICMWASLQDCQTTFRGLYTCTPLMPWHNLEGANIDFTFMKLEGWGDPGPTVALDA